VAANVSKGYIPQIESGARKGTLKVLRAIAVFLDVDLDDLVGPDEQ
jgi:transcriptional regulator with XRE-family HTH domain